MQINLDTIKDGKTNYGMNGTDQRDKVYEWRWQQFIDVVEEKYPEYYLKFYSHRKVREYHLLHLGNNINFKMKHKLLLSLHYVGMETVNFREFEKIMKKLRNYFQQGDGANEEVRAAFTDPLPLYYHQFQ